MVASLQDSTQIEILLDSDLIGVVLVFYLFLLLTEFISFLNIYAIDEVEFLYNEQSCVECKHKFFFIIQKSKNKKIISKKTLILECIAYGITILTMILLVCSLWIHVDVSLIIVGIWSLIVFAFCIIAGEMYRKSKKINRN